MSKKKTNTADPDVILGSEATPESNKADSGQVTNEKTTDKSKQLEDQLKRVYADYQNLEKRVEEERRLLGQLSSAILIEKFLPILDNLESAQTHLNDQGLAIVIKQFNDVLSQEGVVQIEAEGQEFNPNFHEAAEAVEGENDGKIVKVLRKGYKLNDKILRPAQVVVERKDEKETLSSHPHDLSDDSQESEDQTSLEQGRKILDQVENDTIN